MTTDRPTPYADLLPPLSSDEYEVLVADIAANGLTYAITVDAADGTIIDGHHRLRACQQAGVEPRFVDLTFTSEIERRAAALRMNMHRRNLSPEQRAEIRKLQRTDFDYLRERTMTIEGAAAVLGVPLGTAKMWAADISIVGSNNAYVDQRVSVPPPLRRTILSRRDAGETQVQIAADLGVTQARVSQLERIERARLVEPAAVETPGFPTGPFRTIVIDPPWPVVKAVKETRPDQGVALDYPTMALTDITALPIGTLADPRGSHLYLWTTHKLLQDALDMVDDWGFRYQCLLTWVKPVGVSPFSWMYDTEHCIFARGGTGLDLLQMGLRLSVHAAQQPHSKKPDEFYQRVIQASPEPRLEMFCRDIHEGFTPWPAKEVAA